MARWWTGITLCGCMLTAASVAEAQVLPQQSTAPTTLPGGKPNEVASQPATVPTQGVPTYDAGTMPNGMAQIAPGMAGSPYAPNVGPTTGGGGPVNAFTDDAKPTVPPSYLHANFEYWHLWMTKAPVPTLLTAGSSANAFPGAIGQSGTTVLIGNTDARDFARNGGQVSLAWDLDDVKSDTLAVSYFLMEEGNAAQTASSTGTAGSLLLARPFFNSATQSQLATTLTTPGTRSGTFAVHEPHRLQGGEFNWTHNDYYTGFFFSRLGFILGGRVNQLEESMETVADSTLLATGVQTTVNETFRTRNNFYGGQVGLEWEGVLGNLSLLLSGKTAVGLNDMTLDINSLTVTRAATGAETTTANSSFLVGPANAGNFTHQRITSVSDVRAKLSYAFNEHVSVSLGYLGMYFSNVIRPGYQIYRFNNVPVSPVVPPASGVSQHPTFVTSNVVAHGLTLGLMLSY